MEQGLFSMAGKQKLVNKAGGRRNAQSHLEINSREYDGVNRQGFNRQGINMPLD